MIDGDQEALTSNPVGEKLRAARQDRGLTLDEVAAMTRVPTRHLEHIENGRWESLPAITYSLGFARAYAKVVGLNGSEIGSELRAQLGAAPAPSSTMSHYEPADPARVPPRSLAIVAGVIAILLAIGYLVWRSNAVGETDPLAEAAAVDTPITAPPPGSAGAPVATQPLGGSSAATANGPVVLTATDEVWLRVYDGRGGPSLFQNSLRAGERFVIPSNAQQPMIRTGRPNALRVTVGNREIPPLGPAERTIADVSLLPADLLARAQPGQAPGSAAPQPNQPVQTPSAR